MKKIYLMLIFTGLFISAKAQNQVINGDLSIGQDAGNVTGSGNRLTFNGVQSNTDELSIFRFNRSFNVSDLRVNVGDDYGSGGDRFVIGTQNWADSKYYTHMIVGADGKVGIGTETFGSERFAVNGGIRAHEIKVETANWPDYVFDQDYKILGLQELNAYIKQHKHLPEMPSAQEIKLNGVALGETSKLLLKKVEELTLHLIEKDVQLKTEKQINTNQQSLIKSLQEQLDVVMKRLDAIEKK